MSDEQPRTETMSHEEFFAARRETMGADYPGDEAMRQFDREADGDFERWRSQESAEKPETAAASASEAEATEFNARDWLRETFKDDPNYDKLSADEHARLEALATEKQAGIQEDTQNWATEVGKEWAENFRNSVTEGLESSPTLHTFAEDRLSDGDFSSEDQAALRDMARDIDAKEAVEVVRPILETAHDFKGEITDGVELIVDHAIDDVHEIVEARAEMTGGDTPEIQTLLDRLDEAPAQIEEALNFERESDDYEWGKVEDRLDAIRDGADPHSLHDADTFQQDPNTDVNETAEA